jgi:hypothetical protein
MGKTDAVIDVLPSVYGARDETKLLTAAVRALATPLEAADTDVHRVQQSHRLMVASQPRDILRLAAALDLAEFHFQDLLEADLDHVVRLELMRRRVRRIAALHLDGLGTPWAIVSAAATFLGGEVVPESPGGPLLRPLDPDGYSHIATVELAHAHGGGRESIVLHENPFRRLKVDPAPRWPGDGWVVDNGSEDVGSVRVAIRGVGDRTVRPTVFCPGVPGGLVFNGIVPDGETLIIDEDVGARLGDRDVTRWLTTYHGGMHDSVDFGGADVAIEAGEALPPFDPSVESEEDWRRAHPPLPRPPLGRSTWHFAVAGGVFDGSDQDFATFDPPDAPVGIYGNDPPETPIGDSAFDAAVYDVEPSGIVGMAWDERLACAFKLMLPAYAPAPGTAPAQDPQALAEAARARTSRIAAVLPRFRAAGVTAFVETAPDAWVLGRGVLRPLAAADGEGIDFHAARLVSPGTEDIVQFDPAAAAPVLTAQET